MKKIIFTALLTMLIAGCAVQENPQDTAKDESSATESIAWKLDESSNPDAPVYTGKSELKGWIVQAPKYIDDMSPHFHIADDYFKTLPEPIRGTQNYLLKEWDNTNPADPNFVNVSEDVIKELETYSETNPATIIVDRIVISQEGSPSLGLVEIVQK